MLRLVHHLPAELRSQLRHDAAVHFIDGAAAAHHEGQVLQADPVAGVGQSAMPVPAK